MLRDFEMTEEYAREICTWRYEAPYDVYNAENSEESVESFLEGLHYAVTDEEGRLEAFYALGPQAALPIKELAEIYDDEDYTDIALGVRPDLLGRGIGTEVFRMALSRADELFEGDGYRVTVAADNKRALSIYERAGFEEICSFRTEIIYPDANEEIRTKETPMLIMISESSLLSQ